MDWFELSVRMPGDEKFQNLAARLREPLAFGYVVRIYAHCYLHETDRFSGPGAVAAIETAAGWRKKTGHLVAILLEPDVAVLERTEPECFVVHGVGKRLESALKRRNDALKRKQKWRETQHAERVTGETGTRDGTRDDSVTERGSSGYLTRPDQTRPKREEEEGARVATLPPPVTRWPEALPVYRHALSVLGVTALPAGEVDWEGLDAETRRVGLDVACREVTRAVEAKRARRERIRHLSFFVACLRRAAAPVAPEAHADPETRRNWV